MFDLIRRFIRWNWNLDHGGMDALPQQPTRMITHVVQRSTYVSVRSGSSELFTKNGQLIGYTGNSVTVRPFNASWILTYDARGREIASANA